VGGWGLVGWVGGWGLWCFVVWALGGGCVVGFGLGAASVLVESFSQRCCASLCAPLTKFVRAAARKALKKGHSIAVTTSTGKCIQRRQQGPAASGNQDDAGKRVSPWVSLLKVTKRVNFPSLPTGSYNALANRRT